MCESPSPPPPPVLVTASIGDAAGTAPLEVRPDLPEQGEGAGRAQGHRLPDLRLRQRVRHEQQPARVRGVASRETKRDMGVGEGREGRRRGLGGRRGVREVRVTKSDKVMSQYSAGYVGSTQPFLHKEVRFFGRIRNLHSHRRGLFFFFAFFSWQGTAVCRSLPLLSPVPKNKIHQGQKLLNLLRDASRRLSLFADSSVRLHTHQHTGWTLVVLKMARTQLPAAFFCLHVPPPRLRPRPPRGTGARRTDGGTEVKKTVGGPARRASTERLSASPED